MIQIILLIILFALFVWHRFHTSHLYLCGEKIPGPPTLPILGNIHLIPSSGIELLEMRRKWAIEYGPVVRFWMGIRLMISLTDAKDCETILRDRKQLNKSSFYKFLHSWLGLGLLTSTGDKWHRRRKAITPTFHFKILEQFIEVFNRNGDILIESLKNQNVNGFDVKPLITRYALDVICETAMGIKIDAQVNKTSPYFDAVRNMCNLLIMRAMSPWLHSELSFKALGYKSKENQYLAVLHGLTNKVIEEKKAQQFSDQEKVSGDKPAFLELLLKMKNDGTGAFATDDDIAEEVNTFMFEGHDTTTTAICFALNILAEHPEVQEKIFDEVKEIFKKENMDYNDFKEMKFLDRVIKECLRLYPSVPIVSRQLTEDVDIPSGYTLPAGSTVSASIFFVHRNAKYFPIPLKFNPDNFLPEAVSKRHPYAYIPFSAGPRNCIGQKFAMMELKSVLAKIILNFKIEPVGGSWKLQPDPGVVLLSKTGHMIKLAERMK